MKWLPYLKRRLRAGQEEPLHLRTGRWGERIARKMLKSKGYRILGNRFRIGRKDELDIVASFDDVLVFVEVKTRKNETFGRPLSAVDSRKRHALTRAAVRYLTQLKNRPSSFRFDVIEVIGSLDSATPPTVRHIESAFTLGAHHHLQW